jgi:TolA-binding protein
MRVTVLYKDQASYAPKAMFYAGRCFNLLGGEEDDERANKLYARVMRQYPGTVWADEARNFRK